MKNKRQKYYNIASALALAMLVSTGSLASTITHVTATASANSLTATDGDSILQQAGTFASASAGVDGASASSGTSVDFGWARVTSGASSTGPDANWKANASSQGMWRDDLTFSAPGVSGGGTATVRFDVSGSLGALSGGGSLDAAGADWNLYFQSGNVIQSFSGAGSVNDFSGGFTSTGDINGGTYYVNFDFSYNLPIQVIVALNTSVSARSTGTASALFGNTLEWGGITELRDSGGNLITNFSIASGSSVDWTQAVSAPAAIPVPAAVWLFGSGLIGLIGMARRKKS